MTLTPEEVAGLLVDWVHLLGPIQEAKGLTLNVASGLSATVHIDGDRHAVVPKLLDDVRAAASLIRTLEADRRSLAERVEKLEGALEGSRGALKAFAGKVFNDNGDMTVNLSTSSDEILAAYWAERKIRAALERA